MAISTIFFIAIIGLLFLICFTVFVGAIIIIVVSITRANGRRREHGMRSTGPGMGGLLGTFDGGTGLKSPGVEGSGTPAGHHHTHHHHHSGTNLPLEAPSPQHHHTGSADMGGGHHHGGGFDSGGFGGGHHGGGFDGGGGFSGGHH